MNSTEVVLRVFLESSQKVLRQRDVKNQLQLISQAVSEAHLFRRVAVQLYPSVYGEKLFGFTGVTDDERLWLETHDTMDEHEYERVRRYGVDLGGVYFVPHDLLPLVVPHHEEVLLAAPSSWKGPGWWHPDDMLFAPFYTADGLVLGNLTADEPYDERIPDPSIATLMAPFLSMASALVELALTVRRDPLTNCFNGRFFHDEIARLAERDTLAGLLFADLDNLKQVNDREGHDAGDRLIRDAARQLELAVKRQLDGCGTVCHLHGDEFAVLIRGSAGLEIESVVEACRREVTRSSLGAAIYQPGESLSSLLRRAELSMYAHKQERKRHGLTAP